MKYTWQYNAKTNLYDVFVNGMYLTSFKTAVIAREYCEYRNRER